jgi:hypothetical protein
MSRLLVMVGVVVLALGTIEASQPGQPLDCSDWAFFESGLSCSVFSNSVLVASNPSWFQLGTNMVIDNTGSLFALRQVTLSTGGTLDTNLSRLELVRFNGSNQSVIAQIEDRNTPNGLVDHIRPSRCDFGGPCFPETLVFDAINGRLLIPVQTYCTQPFDITCPGGNYGHTYSFLAISGFAPLFEILQTYTPTPPTLSFTSPAIPEGLSVADHFDTYWGRISDLPDFTKAQPMACGYHASHPAVGASLTVADTSPNPPLGQANYMVTSVTHETDRRYGRQLIGSVLAGRNPELLPACEYFR